ncbi:hypothetical protein THRCLA_04935 [Thraustotheca clavata]|uniref:Uncharacterized protein n=1 Tax=Thraustotheca clavata TaxID=74557 RepID=A0A1V9ZXM1_9STRA|nr:hypothetical protein THRCLA_04935 [Thraustotheca clavata]
MYEGFLPIATKQHRTVYLLPKLHLERCVLTPKTLHIPKSIRKKAKHYTLTFNTAYNDVVKGCHAQHGVAWLYPEVVEGFRGLLPGLWLSSTECIRLYSIELWKDGVLVAGELGYTNGKMFTSLTGFVHPDASGAGTMQLYALGSYLNVNGFHLWDLGMSMDYKLRIGGYDIPRKQFVSHVHQLRSQTIPFPESALNLMSVMPDDKKMMVEGRLHGSNDSVLSNGSYSSEQWTAYVTSVVNGEDNQRDESPPKDVGKKKLPSVIYEIPMLGISNGRREISHASLGRLVAKLTDAHHYDTEFRDCFLLTYRCHSTAYEFVKKIIKRYKAAIRLVNPLSIVCDPSNAEEERFSIQSSETIDVNTQAEANISIMRTMSVLKFWIRESGYINADLSNDRKAQKKLFLFLEEVRKTSQIPSIVVHAEKMLHVVGKILKATTILRQQQQIQKDNQLSAGSRDMPSPLDLGKEEEPSVYSQTAPLPSKQGTTQLKITRSSSDSKREALKASTVPTLIRNLTSSGIHDDPRIAGILVRSHSDCTKEVKGKYVSISRSEPLSGVTAIEAAEQLTLLEEYRYNKIQPRELTNKCWTGENKHTDAPNVLALIELFDARAGWVSSEILHPKLQAKQRAKMIAFFIDVAEACHHLNNFNTLFEIVTGLKAPCLCVGRRTAFFLVTKDLFGYEESMPTMEHGLICFQKFRKIYRTIMDALGCQQVKYTSTSSSSRRRKPLIPEKNVQMMLKHRLETIRKPNSELFRLAKNANRQENVLFVNSLADAGFM